MSDWKEADIKFSLNRNQADIHWRKGNGLAETISVRRIPFDQPGEQTESEIQEAVRKAAKKQLQELLGQL